MAVMLQVAIDELRFGDNDTLSALVAGLVEAQWLFLLTDVDGLFTADPVGTARVPPYSHGCLACYQRKDPNAKPIRVVERIDDLKVDIGKPGSWGTVRPPPTSPPRLTTLVQGGMATKITAARYATVAGVRTVITRSDTPENILRILKGTSTVLPRHRWSTHWSCVSYAYQARRSGRCSSL